MDERALNELQALVTRDHELEDGASSLRSLDAAVSEIRKRAEAIRSFFAEHSEEDARLHEVEARELEMLEGRRAELAEAEADLSAARSDEERLLAEHRVQRGVDHVQLAERAVEEARTERRRFDEEADELARELPGLEARAHTMGMADGDLLDWTSAKRAELFVALGQLDTQRERMIREANELATAVLGEPTFGSTPAQALERVERYWRSSPGQVSESR